MSPTFQQIWFGEWTGICQFHPQLQYARSRTYFRIRSAIRTAIWLPITVYVFAGLTGWLA